MNRNPEKAVENEAATRPQLSVVIVSWNTRELLLNTLHSFLPVDELDCEVIVVDNASSDGSSEAVRSEFPDAKLICNATNLGFARGVNCGLRASSHPYVLLLNSDTLVVDDAIQMLVAYASAHPEAGIIGPRVLNADGSLQHSRFRFPSLLNLALQATYLYKLFPNSSFLNRERLPEVGDREPQPVEVVSGCCFLIRRELIDEVGVLDEGYFMYAEETDLCRRAWDQGFEVHYAPVGEIIHFGGGSSRLARLRNFLEFRRSILRFFVMYRGRGVAELARVLMLGFLVVRWPYWRLRALLRPEKAEESLGQAVNYGRGIRFLLQPLPRILGRSGEPIDLGRSGPAEKVG